MSFTEPYRNVAGLSPEKIKELLACFEKLKDFGGDLHDRVVRYVLDGDDESVLGELAGKTDAAHALGLLCADRNARKASWRGFFDIIEPIDCRFYLRLGKVFEVTAKNLSADRFFCQDVFDQNLWLEILLQESVRTAARNWSSRESATAISAVLIEGMLKADGRSVDIFIVSAFNEAGKKWPTNIARDDPRRERSWPDVRSALRVGSAIPAARERGITRDCGRKPRAQRRTSQGIHRRTGGVCHGFGQALARGGGSLGADRAPSCPAALGKSGR